MIPTGLLFSIGAIGTGSSAVAGFFSVRIWLALLLTGIAAAMAGTVSLLAANTDWNWSSPFAICGEAVQLRGDGLSAFFLLLLGVIGSAGAVYSTTYWKERSHPRSARAGRAWWSLLVFCLGYVLLAADGLHFLIAWELFTLSAYFLVTLDRQRSEVREAGWLYLAASHVSMVCLFAFFGALAARTGSWAIGPMRGRTECAPLFWLALVGFGLKAGAFPLHVWLPSAHANAPSHVSAILSGVTIKLGLYGLLRFSGWLPMPAMAGWTVAAIGVTSAVLGVAFALGQHDLKRLLAYHSVENVGIILLGLGFALVAARRGNAADWGRLALAGGLLHVWNHGLFKALLFFGAGSVLHATGTREMSQLGGLWRAMPWTTGLFALGAMAISGLPPLNGFVSEWLIYLGLFDAANGHGPSAWTAMPAAILLSVTGALALACFVKVCGIVFLGAPRSEAAEKAHESGWAMRGAMFVPAAACAAIGLAPSVFLPSLQRATESWEPAWRDAEFPAPLGTLGWINVALAAGAIGVATALWRTLRRRSPARALSWDCGYAAPTARMQYTAGSFARTLVEWFAWILRPQRQERRPEEALAATASFSAHTPETVLEQVIQPAGAAVMRVSAFARSLQHGRVQAYLFYLLIGVGALAALAASMDPP